jgi:hypothetical protein
MRFFWYLSRTKLDHLLSQQQTGLDALKAGLSRLIKAEIKVSPISVALESKSSEVDAEQIHALEKVEKKLRDSGAVGSIGDYRAGRQPVFFQFHGPAARLIQDGQFWIASLERRTAVLLAGSATHCIGGPDSVENVISPSVDPIGSMQSLLTDYHEIEDRQLADKLSNIWTTIVSNSNIGEFGSLPRTTGIAIFAGATKSDSAQIQYSGYDGDIDQIVVGSPLFVEQVASLD